MDKLTASIVSSWSRNENTTFVYWSQTSSSKFQVTLAFTDIKCPKPESKDEKILKYYIIHIFVRMKCIWVGFSIILGKKTRHSSVWNTYVCFLHAEKNIGYTARLEKDVNPIFFIVRLLPSLEMDLCDFDTYCKMTTFLSATNSKRKKRLCEDFIFKAIISSISIPLSQPLNTWRDSKV